MRTWSQLTLMAGKSGRRLLRTPGCVTVYPHQDSRSEEITITTGNMDVVPDADADLICRAALEAVLLELKAQDSRKMLEEDIQRAMTGSRSAEP